MHQSPADRRASVDVGRTPQTKLDRVACPWLIRGFVEPQAEFPFVNADQGRGVAAGEGAVPFGVPGVQQGHDPGRCSFEAIVAERGLRDDYELLARERIVYDAHCACCRPEVEAAGFLAPA